MSTMVSSTRQLLRVNESGTNLELDNEVLEDVFGQIPKNMNLAIVSIAGALRSGKSFFLDLCLRYLRSTQDGNRIMQDTSNEEWKNWIYEGINGHSDILEGRSNIQETDAHNGFSWRSGSDRNTVGMWIWDKPFYRKCKSGETIAVFLVDTQGLFDFESSKMLTTRIFGLSALLSSYQIYNVDKRVQEDNLQHLAMFAEYGRLAFLKQGEYSDDAVDHNSENQREFSNQEDTMQPESDIPEFQPPFQHLNFLVRDWQNFSRKQSLEEMKEDMEKYKEDIFKLRHHGNQEFENTRDHIRRAFEQISCFLLCHPGHEVTDIDYNGSVSAIDERFLMLLTVHLDEIFAEDKLEAKKIHGSFVTSNELCAYFECYVDLFQKAEIFPVAQTMLEATSEIHSMYTINKAIKRYKSEMEIQLEGKNSRVSDDVLNEYHASALQNAVEFFIAEATKMGQHRSFKKHLQEFLRALEGVRAYIIQNNNDKTDLRRLLTNLALQAVILGGMIVFKVRMPVP